jgi:hypothetical protein
MADLIRSVPVAGLVATAFGSLGGCVVWSGDPGYYSSGGRRHPHGGPPGHTGVHPGNGNAYGHGNGHGHGRGR